MASVIDVGRLFLKRISSILSQNSVSLRERRVIMSIGALEDKRIKALSKLALSSGIFMASAIGETYE